MTRCDCHACRARDDRRYWRTIEHGWTQRERLALETSAAVVGRVNEYGYNHGPKLPPVPEWVGEPTEYEGGTL